MRVTRQDAEWDALLKLLGVFKFYMEERLREKMLQSVSGWDDPNENYDYEAHMVNAIKESRWVDLANLATGMNITGGGKVTLNPKNKDERTALWVLQLITCDPKLEDVILMNKGQGESNVDCTINSQGEQGIRSGFLNTFADEAKYDIISVVFRDKEKV